jgi:hypothetical protein
LSENSEKEYSKVRYRVLEARRKKNITVKYGRKSQGTRTRETLRWQGPPAYIKDRPILSSERAPNRNKTVTVEEQ